MKDWFTVEPDKFALVGSHRYTAGRGGKSIQYVTRHHIMGNMTTEQVRDLWQYDREASAHYVVENSGLIGQIVYDKNTAWSNGNAVSNRVSVSIEHANNTGRYNGNDYHDKSWNISDMVIREGAKLGAALCWYYKLGRPVLGKNIRDHNEFTATGCPVHLKRGGKYSDQWMRIAQEHYDWMVREKAGQNTSAPTPKEDDMFTDEDRKMLARVHHELTYKFQSRYEDPETGEQSAFKETLIGYILELDKKMESVNVVRLPGVQKAIESVKDLFNKESK